MLSVYFTLPADFATDTLAYIGGFASDLIVPITIVCGIGLFFLVANWVISKFRSKKA